MDFHLLFQPLALFLGRFSCFVLFLLLSPIYTHSRVYHLPYMESNNIPDCNLRSNRSASSSCFSEHLLLLNLLLQKYHLPLLRLVREPLHPNQKIQMELLVIITCEIQVYRGLGELPDRRSANYRRNPLYT